MYSKIWKLDIHQIIFGIHQFFFRQAEKLLKILMKIVKNQRETSKITFKTQKNRLRRPKNVNAYSKLLIFGMYEKMNNYTYRFTKS